MRCRIGFIGLTLLLAWSAGSFAQLPDPTAADEKLLQAAK